MRSAATTVQEYLDELPEERRGALEQVRAVILDNLPDGIVESVNWGMIAYEVPLETYPDTYNGQPLTFAGLASQKNHMAVYLMGVYGSDELAARFEEAYRATGKRLDMGRSCVRFRRVDDLPLDVVGDAVAALTLPEFLALHQQAASLRTSRTSRSSRASGSGT